MEMKLACLSLAAFILASCDKSGTAANPDDTSPEKPRVENRVEAPAGAARTKPRLRDAPDARTGSAIAPPARQPVDASMIRPAGTAPEDSSWETLTAEQRIGNFNSSGIARMPEDISDKILRDATSAGTPEDQVHFITQQAAAWHHINEFKEGINDIPDHMKLALLESLARKHGDSWKDMVPELDEQVAASVRVMELRLKGIPGMSPDESQDLLINAMEKHGSDYKTILSIANQSAGK
jgi:hypothetical protein